MKFVLGVNRQSLGPVQNEIIVAYVCVTPKQVREHSKKELNNSLRDKNKWFQCSNKVSLGYKLSSVRFKGLYYN